MGWSVPRRRVPRITPESSILSSLRKLFSLILSSMVCHHPWQGKGKVPPQYRQRRTKHQHCPGALEGETRNLCREYIVLENARRSYAFFRRNRASFMPYCWPRPRGWQSTAERGRQDAEKSRNALTRGGRSHAWPVLACERLPGWLTVSSDSDRENRAGDFPAYTGTLAAMPRKNQQRQTRD